MSTDFYAYDAGLPCRNPYCKSKGRPHPNCRCYAGSARSHEEYAKGGAVECSGPHKPDCEYYADGGVAGHAPAYPSQPNPAVTLGHAALHHGLLGLLKDVGHSNLANPEKHIKHLEKTKMHISMNNPDKATLHLHGNPLAGSVGKDKLKHILTSLSPTLLSQDSSPAALRSSIDYLHSAVRGHDTLDGHVGKILGSDKLSLENDDAAVEKLRAHLDSLNEHPEKMLDVGGSIGHYLPEHAAQIGAMAATATQYLNSIKPKPSQAAPLDEPAPVEKGAIAHWMRQVGIAQNPALIIQHAKNGTLIPTDIMTVSTIYPALMNSMKSKASEALIDARMNKKEIPYRQKQGLSMLLGQPLDFTQTPQAMQAIMHSSGPQQMQNQQKKNAGPKKATGVELKQINRVDEMAETPLEARQINKKSR